MQPHPKRKAPSHNRVLPHKNIYLEQENNDNTLRYDKIGII